MSASKATRDEERENGGESRVTSDVENAAAFLQLLTLGEQSDPSCEEEGHRSSLRSRPRYASGSSGAAPYLATGVYSRSERSVATKDHDVRSRDYATADEHYILPPKSAASEAKESGSDWLPPSGRTTGKLWDSSDGEGLPNCLTDSESVSDVTLKSSLPSAVQQNRIEAKAEDTVSSSHGHSRPSGLRNRRQSSRQTSAMFHEADTVVSPGQLRLLSFVIAPKWRPVAYRLKPYPMERHVVKDIVGQYPNNLQEQAMEMLQMWKDRHGPQACVHVMCEVLINVGCKAEAEEVFGQDTVKKVQSHMSDSDSGSDNPDRLLYELAEEVGVNWLELALDAGMRQHEISIIESEARIPEQQAWKMLCQWRAKIGIDFNIDEMRARLKILRQKRHNKLAKYLIFPEMIHDHKNLRGREAELEEMFKQFWGDLGECEIIAKFCLQVVNGMGGIGKSTAASKYAALWKQRYGGGVFHFNGESYTSLQNSIRQNLRKLGLQFGEGSLMEENQIFLQHVYGTENVLLVYDAADDLNLLVNFLPSVNAHIHVLVTTRMCGNHSVLAKADKITSLGRLPPESGVKALQAWRGRAGEKLHGEEMRCALSLVSGAPIEGLPLAIAHAGTFMERAGVGCEEYQRLLMRRQAALEALVLDIHELLHYFHISNLKEGLLQQGISQPKDLCKLTVQDMESIAQKRNDRHLLSMAKYFVMNTDHVHLTWQLDIDTVKEKDKDAMELLLYASLIGNRNIPVSVLRSLVFGDRPAYCYNLSVSILKEHALVDVFESNEGYGFSLHHLVQSTVRERLMCQPHQLSHKLSGLSHSFLCRLPDSENDIKRSLTEDQFISLLPHVYSLALKTVGLSDDESCVSLVNVACRIALISQHVDLAAYLCTEQLKAVEMSTKASNSRRVEALYCMGRACQLCVNPQAAQQYFSNALQVIERCREHEKRDIAHLYSVVLGSLANCYADQQMFVESESIFLIKLSLLKEKPQENRHEIATTLHNLATNYFSSGELQKAIEMFEQGMEMWASDSSSDPLRVSTTMVCMGWCLVQSCQYERALPLLLKGLAIKKECLPYEHFDVANSLRMLSTCCEMMGEVNKAMRLAEEAHFIALSRLPRNHADIVVFVQQLAACKRKTGNLDEAIQLIQQCIPIQKSNLPASRRNLCTLLNNLGLCYQDKGMFREAMRTWEDCLVARRSFLPPDHPDIGDTLWNLGAACQKRGDIVAASERWRECLSVRERCLPSHHPYFTDVLEVLGDIAYTREQYGEALQLHRRRCDILMTVNPKSSDVATAYHSTGICYFKLSQLDEAEHALSQALKIKTEIYSAGDDRIATTERSLHVVWQRKFGQ